MIDLGAEIVTVYSCMSTGGSEYLAVHGAHADVQTARSMVSAEETPVVPDPSVMMVARALCSKGPTPKKTTRETAQVAVSLVRSGRANVHVQDLISAFYDLLRKVAGGR